MQFQHDVFISYSSADREWAKKLSAAIGHEADRYSVFLDEQSLRAGDNWEETIQSSLETSQSLVVLWSDRAKESQWVSRELFSFMATARPKMNLNRRIIVINLQGSNLATNSYQQITSPELQQAYSNSAQPAVEVWRKVIADVKDGLNPGKRPLFVPLVVLTLTSDEFNGLAQTQRERLRSDFGLSDAFLSARYGTTRMEWKPFAGSEPIVALLESVRTSANHALKAHRLDWKLADDVFWTDPIAASRFVNNDFNTSDLSLLIIDPVAVHSLDVLQRLMLFQDSLTSDRRVIVTLPPFGVPPRLKRLRDALTRRTTPYFDDYFYPAVPTKRRLLAQCAWNVTDGEDIQRHILAAAGHLGSKDIEATSPFIRHG